MYNCTINELGGQAKHERPVPRCPWASLSLIEYEQLAWLVDDGCTGDYQREVKAGGGQQCAGA